MGPLETLWHLLNFFAPAFGIGIIAPALAKLLWRRTLKAKAWWTLSSWATAAAALATLGGLLLFGRDGRMASYGLMVASSALALWWAAFGRLR